MSDFILHLLSMGCIYGMLALALNLQIGFGGLMNFGLVAMFACGLYGAGVAHRFDWPLWAGAALALGMAVLLALFLARLARVLSADYWGIATLSIAEVIRIFATNLEPLTGGAQGISGLPEFFTALGTQQNIAVLALYAVVLGLMGFGCRILTGSELGLGMKLMREEPQFARALGHDVDRIQRIVMLVSSLMAAIAGWLYAYYLGFVGPEQLVAPETFLIWSMVILGGFSNHLGVVLGAFLLQILMASIPFLKDALALPSDFVAAARLMLTGGLILGFLMFRPRGLMPEKIGG